MKILVTGGAGFIGSHIVDKLILANHNVSVIDNLSTGSLRNINPNASFISLDIRDTKLLPLFIDEKFDYVIHQAGQTMVPKSLEEPAFDCEVNIMGTVNLLEACRKTAVKRVVFASTAAVYGNVSAVPVVESAPTEPTSFYGLSKLVVEKYLNLYKAIYGLEFVILRYANVYGERQGDSGEGGVISIFAKKIYNNLRVDVFGDGHQTRDFIYVGDVAAANIAAIFTKSANSVYNISTATETTVNELITNFSIIASSTINTQYHAPRTGDIYRSALSNSLAKQHLNWNPDTALCDGLMRAYTSFQKA